MKYRKKPIVIEAFQWFPEMGAVGGVIEIGKHVFIIPTLEGDHEVSPGDYVITGIKNEKYPCKPDIFELTYEAVEE